MLRNDSLDRVVAAVLTPGADFATPYGDYIQELGLSPPVDERHFLDHWFLSAGICWRIGCSVLSTQYWRIDGNVECYKLGKPEQSVKKSMEVLRRLSGKPDKILQCRDLPELMSEIRKAEKEGEILVVTNLPAYGITEPLVYSTLAKKRGLEENNLAHVLKLNFAISE